ncbi:hypothetical protein ACFOW1_02105 [Parasediminibacterium paludis]|uniref:Uncharacterized protein n=1 Tax=Parasediminibacterium paludis TaxID=908966 RepID=A0ABV8PV94_9BACT
MKFLLLSVLSFSSVIGFAQQSPSLKLARENRLNNLSLNKPIDNMPSANIGPSGQMFLYNNGNGLNIYKSQPDDMPVAKPDSSYLDNMIAKPTAPKTMTDVINKLKNNRFQPKGNAKYNFVLPTYKDSLPYIDSTNKLLLKPKF